jgi:hypothetical protein
MHYHSIVALTSCLIKGRESSALKSLYVSVERQK